MTLNTQGPLYVIISHTTLTQILFEKWKHHTHAYRQYKRYKAHAGCFHQPDGLRHALLLQIARCVKYKE